MRLRQCDWNGIVERAQLRSAAASRPRCGSFVLDILKETNFGFLGPKTAGKVRDIYERNGKLVLITTDRHSSFDRIIAHIPWKGQVLNQVSAWWFEKTRDIVPNHVLAIPDPNVTIAKKCAPLPVEAVVRDT